MTPTENPADLSADELENLLKDPRSTQEYRILRATRRLLAREGLGVSIDAIAVEAGLGRRTIFRYFVKQAAREPAGPALRPVVEQDFTQVNPLDYRPVFRSTAVRDDFNAGLRLLKANGRFQAIYDRYLRA